MPQVFVPVPWSVLGPSRRFLTSLVRGAAVGLLDGAKPLAARGCFLLLRLGLVTYGRADNICLAVCNLHYGTCDVLPLLENMSSASMNYAVVTSEDYGSSSSLFMVLAMSINVYHRSKLHCDMRMLTSYEPSWTTYTECFTGDFGIGWQHCSDAVAVVCGGVACWFFTYIDYNGRSQLSTIEANTCFAIFVNISEATIL